MEVEDFNQLQHLKNLTLKILGKHGSPNVITHLVASTSTAPDEHFPLFAQVLYHIEVNLQESTIKLSNPAGKNVLTCIGTITDFQTPMHVKLANGTDLGILHGYEMIDYAIEQEENQLILDKETVHNRYPFDDAKFITICSKSQYKHGHRKPSSFGMIKSTSRLAALFMTFNIDRLIIHQSTKALILLMSVRLMFACYSLNNHPMPPAIPHLMPPGTPTWLNPLDSLNSFSKARFRIACSDAANRHIGEILYEPNHDIQLVIFMNLAINAPLLGECKDVFGRLLFRFQRRDNKIYIYNTDGVAIGTKDERTRTITEKNNESYVFNFISNFPGNKRGTRATVATHALYGQVAFCQIDQWEQLSMHIQQPLASTSKACLISVMSVLAMIYYRMWQRLVCPTIPTYQFREVKGTASEATS